MEPYYRAVPRIRIHKSAPYALALRFFVDRGRSPDRIRPIFEHQAARLRVAAPQRYYGLHHLHYLTTSTYRRARLFDSDRFKLNFTRTLDELRSEIGFATSSCRSIVIC